MSTVNTDRLYQLLPAIYRLRDGEQGSPLRALIEVLAGQAELVELDITRLYENWFIETGEEWVVPYLGDLLGIRGLLPPERIGWSQRALVANTLQYRQRKGTLPLLEQLVHDVTGWVGRAVELYNQVSVTQYFDHLRPGLGGTANLRQLHDVALVGSAFDPLAYTPDIRLMSGTRPAPQLEAERPATRSGRQFVGVGQGRPNLPNLGLYIWRLRPYRLEQAPAFSHRDNQRFSFSPLGHDIRLFNTLPETRNFANVAREHELPVALRTGALAAELETYREALAEGDEPEQYFFGEQPAFKVYLPGANRPVELKDILVFDLGDWDNQAMPAQLPAKTAGSQEDGKASDVPYLVVVDPERGRIFVPGGVPAGAVRVSYSYAFSGNIGGGPYDRRNRAADQADTVANPGALGTLISIGSDGAISPAPKGELQIFPIPADDEFALQTALKTWSAHNCPKAVIQIGTHGSYVIPQQKLRPRSKKVAVPPIELHGSQLVIQAANGCRPALVSDLIIDGGGVTAELTLSGLLIAGQIKVTSGLGKLTIIDCTVVPGITLDTEGLPASPTMESLIVPAALGTPLRLQIGRSIVGPICLPDTKVELVISDSIIDAPEPDAGVTQKPAVVGPTTRLERVTVFGPVRVREISLAEDVLFTARVTVERRDTGGMRHCYLPAGSKTPFREACQDGSPQLQPAFTARRYGEPGYAQLSLACPAEIRAGGTVGAEIGVFHHLRQPQREAALLAQLEEYVRFGLETGLIYVT